MITPTSVGNDFRRKRDLHLKVVEKIFAAELSHKWSYKLHLAFAIERLWTSVFYFVQIKMWRATNRRRAIQLSLYEKN